MKKSLFRWFAIGLMIILTIVYSKVVEINPSKVISSLPQIEFTLLGGEKNVLAHDKTKKLLIVHLWATWCSSCIEELPQLLRFYDKAQQEGVEMLLLAVDDEPVKVLKLFNELNLNKNLVRIGFINSNDLQKFSTNKLPETAIYKDGREIFRYVGPQEWQTSLKMKELLSLIK